MGRCQWNDTSTILSIASIYSKIPLSDTPYVSLWSWSGLFILRVVDNNERSLLHEFTSRFRLIEEIDSSVGILGQFSASYNYFWVKNCNNLWLFLVNNPLTKRIISAILWPHLYWPTTVAKSTSREAVQEASMMSRVLITVFAHFFLLWNIFTPHNPLSLNPKAPPAWTTNGQKN